MRKSGTGRTSTGGFAHTLSVTTFHYSHKKAISISYARFPTLLFFAVNGWRPPPLVNSAHGVSNDYFSVFRQTHVVLSLKPQANVTYHMTS